VAAVRYSAARAACLATACHAAAPAVATVVLKRAADADRGPQACGAPETLLPVAAKLADVVPAAMPRATPARLWRRGAAASTEEAPNPPSGSLEPSGRATSDWCLCRCRLDGSQRRCWNRANGPLSCCSYSMAVVEAAGHTVPPLHWLHIATATVWITGAAWAHRRNPHSAFELRRSRFA
jgi:hypothetical protein